jgi:2-keto-3-deoxy-L-fuconate dehydrogenase
MSGRLQGKRALVTAAGAGIGRAAAQAFAAEGAHVLATDVNAAALESLAGEGIRTARLDVTDARAVLEVVSGRGPEVLVNAAGWVHHGTVLDCDEEALQRSLSLNVVSMHRASVRRCRPCWRRAPGRSSTSLRWLPP